MIEVCPEKLNTSSRWHETWVHTRFLQIKSRLISNQALITQVFTDMVTAHCRIRCDSSDSEVVRQPASDKRVLQIVSCKAASRNTLRHRFRSCLLDGQTGRYTQSGLNVILSRSSAAWQCPTLAVFAGNLYCEKRSRSAMVLESVTTKLDCFKRLMNRHSFKSVGL